MNENCKYCKTSKTCLENADYGSIYCQLHKRIPKVIDKTYDELKQENQLLKEEKKELIDYLKKEQKKLEKNKIDFSADYYVDRKMFLKEILSKIENR